MNTRTRWTFIVGLTVLLTALLFIPMSEAKRDRKSASRGDKRTSLPSSKDRSADLSLGRSEKGLGSWKPTASLQQSPRLTPVVSQAVGFGESPAARDIPAAVVDSFKAQGKEINEENEDLEREPVKGAHPFDAALYSSRSAQANASVAAVGPPILTFEGLADVDNAGLVNPSDSNGAVGPSHYVEVVNNRVRVFDKAGNPLTAPFSQSTLFASLGGICSTNNNGDPIVLYDRMADRWQVSQFAFTGQTTPPYHECIAESKTNDPTGAYYVYDFVLPGNQFPDYPKLSSWPDAYYMSTREFTMGGPFAGEGAVAFDRKKMLVGDPTASLIFFDIGSLSNSSSGMLPSDFDGIIPPPAGAPNVFAIYTSTTFGDPGDAVRLFNFHVDFGTPVNSTFLERPESPVAVAAFDPRNPNGRADIEQPPPSVATDNLDSIGDRLMFRLQYRNRGGTESLVSVHTVNVSGVNPTTAGTYQAAPRFYELRKATPGGTYAVYDQATFSPDAGNGGTGINRWMGSAAIDNSANLAVGYSASSTTLLPEIRYGGRSSTFTGGLDQGEATMFAGLGTQCSTTPACTSGNRWGDYSDLTVDPVDDCSFWYVNEYYPAGYTQFNWHTRIGKFTVGTCTAPAQGMLRGTVTTCDTGTPIGLIQVEVSGGPSDGFSATTLSNGTYSMKLAPGTYSVTFSNPVRSCAVSGPFTVTIADGGTTTLDACMNGSPQVAFVAAVVSGGNGNNVIDRNECNALNVRLNNPGCGALTGVSAVLSTSTSGVEVTQPNSAYPNIPAGLDGTNTAPFQVSTAPGFVCGTTINFTLTISSNQGSFTINFSLPTCLAPPSTVTGSITNTDPTQTGRIARNGVASSCASAKAYPGTNDALVRNFDQYSFTNNGGVTACATFNLTSGCGVNVFGLTYLGSYNPASIPTNYLGDPGASAAGTTTWSVNVPAGATVVLVVHEITPGSGCASYSATVSGLFTNTDGGGECPPTAILNAAGSTLVNESCPPFNSMVDPGERVSVNLAVMNSGTASTTAALTGTLQASANVLAPSGPQTYGAIAPSATASRTFSFTANGTCGQVINLTLQLQDGTRTLGPVTFPITLGCNTSCSEARLVVTQSFGCSGSNVSMRICVENQGITAASNVTLTSVTLGTSSATSLPGPIPTIAPGATVCYTPITFTPNPSPGTKLLKIKGTYDSGSTFSKSQNVVVPSCP